MFKLIAFYAKPDDVVAFDRHYADVHLPLVRKIPGLSCVIVSRGQPAPWGEPIYYMVVEMVFPDQATLDGALRSPENAAAGRDLKNFAAGRVTLMIASESV